MKIKQKSRNDQLRDLLNDYIETHGETPVDLPTVYRWAMCNKLWTPPERSQLKLFKDEMARAAREEYCTDAQGRQVRRKHAVVIKEEGGVQRSFWANIESAPPAHMHLSLQQRRRGILGDVTQLKTDMDSYNENYNPDKTKLIQLSFNFEDDLAETAQDTTYSDTPPEEDESEEDGEG